MKKVILLLLVGLAASASSAQNWEKGVLKGVQGVVKDSSAPVLGGSIGQQVERRVISKVFEGPIVQLARITNWAESPLLRLSLSSVPTDISSTQILPARAINGEIFRRVVFPQPGVRSLPFALNDNSPALYRGMPLDLKDIKNLLINGIQVERSSFPQLYFSADIDIALSCANEENLLLPTVVKVNVTPDLEMVRPPRLYEYDNYVFNGSIPAKYVSDVMVLLEINGVATWYKAVLEKDELLFKPTTTSLFQKGELIKHRFDAPSSLAPDISLRSLWENFGKDDGLW